MRDTAVSRRRFLMLGGAAVAGIAGVANCDSGTAPEDPAVNSDDLKESPRITPTGGVLSASLIATTSPLNIAGRMALEPVSYNGLACGPTLVLRPGMNVNLTLSNLINHTQGAAPLSAETAARAQSIARSVRGARRSRTMRHRHAEMSEEVAGDLSLGAVTNLHFHGFHVTPSGTGDNPFLLVAAGHSLRYNFAVPATHPAGLFWYHPHVPGLVTNQLGRGAAGLISIENAYTDSIAARGIRRRLMQLHQVYFDSDQRTVIPDDDNKDDTSDTVTLSLINGQLHPRIYARPGEPQVWAIANTSTTAFYVLSLAGHTFDVIAEDGIPLRSVRADQQQILLSPAKRLEVVVRATGNPGSYALSLNPHEQGFDTWPAKPLATMIVTGSRWTGADISDVDTSFQATDLRSAPATERIVRFGEDPAVIEEGFGGFLIDGRPFDPNRIDFTARLGSVEQWTVINDTAEEHPVHIHTNPFQIVSVNGVSVPFEGYVDTVVLPTLGSMVIRLRFADFGGKTLMHCHIIDHECNGMMAIMNIA